MIKFLVKKIENNSQSLEDISCCNRLFSKKYFWGCLWKYVCIGLKISLFHCQWNFHLSLFQYVFPLCVRARGRVLILTTVIREIQTACGPTPACYVNTTTEPSHPASRIKHPVEIKGFEIENLFHCQDLSELFSYDKEIFSTPHFNPKPSFLLYFFSIMKN